MVRVGKENKLGFECRLLQALGVRSVDLDIPLALHDEHRLGDGRDQLDGIVGEDVDEEFVTSTRLPASSASMAAIA